MKVAGMAAGKGEIDMNIIQMAFQTENTFIRVCRHNTDPKKLILKSPHPEVSMQFCTNLGVNIVKEWQGSAYFITEVMKSEFLAGLAGIPEYVHNMENLESSKQEASTSPVKCLECGSPDGAHWAFCPLHPENKSELN